MTTGQEPPPESTTHQHDDPQREEAWRQIDLMPWHYRNRLGVRRAIGLWVLINLSIVVSGIVLVPLFLRFSDRVVVDDPSRVSLRNVEDRSRSLEARVQQMSDWIRRVEAESGQCPMTELLREVARATIPARAGGVQDALVIQQVAIDLRSANRSNEVAGEVSDRADPHVALSALSGNVASAESWKQRLGRSGRLNDIALQVSSGPDGPAVVRITASVVNPTEPRP